MEGEPRAWNARHLRSEAWQEGALPDEREEQREETLRHFCDQRRVAASKENLCVLKRRMAVRGVCGVFMVILPLMVARQVPDNALNGCELQWQVQSVAGFERRRGEARSCLALEQQAGVDREEVVDAEAVEQILEGEVEHRKAIVRRQSEENRLERNHDGNGGRDVVKAATRRLATGSGP